MQRMAHSQSRFSAWPLIVAAGLSQIVACTGSTQGPTPAPTPTTAGVNADRPCPTNIPDQPTNICPRLKNITVSCGGNGMLHTSVGGGSGSPILLGAKLDDGSVLSAVLVVVNCQDGPREGVTLGVTYTGEVSMPPNAPPCLRQSKAVFSQFQFGNPLNAVFEGLAKEKLHQTLDDEAIKNFSSALGLTAPTMSRCSIWRQMP
jgi:hypothetical protein